MTDNPDVSATDPRPLEVAWYLKHGLYPRERITNDSRGNAYVIGDWSWSMRNPGKREVIETRMKDEI